MFGRAHLGIVDGRRGEAHGPAAGDFGVEWYAGAAAGAVAHEGHVGQRVHERSEVVGGAECAAIGEDNDRLEPGVAIGLRLVVVGVGFGEVVVAGAGLVGDVSGESAARDESSADAFGVGEVAAAVVADVEYHGGAVGKYSHDPVECAFAGCVGERGVAHVGYGVAQYVVCESVARQAVEVQIVLVDEAFVVVLRVVAPPLFVVRGGVVAGEVHMAVVQLVEHGGADIEEVDDVGFGVDLRAVDVVDRVPVDAFFVEEAVVLVDDGPECVEVAFGVIVPLVDAMARGESRESYEQQGYESS